MLETGLIETVDGEPMLALDRPLDGLPAELPAQLAARTSASSPARSAPDAVATTSPTSSEP